MLQVSWGADYLTKTCTLDVAATNITNGTTGSIVYQVAVTMQLWPSDCLGMVDPSHLWLLSTPSTHLVCGDSSDC